MNWKNLTKNCVAKWK